jgi:GMP synthase-like glutamine amidotransferase
MGAYDDALYPYLRDVRELLRRAVQDEVPTLGICLGAQLLAVATGGRVEPNPDGPEIGAQLVAKRAVAATDPLFRSLPITPDVLQWHFDAVTVLPPGAQQLASSPGCQHQAFRLGRLAWGLQFHIETTPEIVREWADSDDYLQDEQRARVISRAESVDADLVEAWRPFAHAFAAVALDPSSVRRSRAVPSTSAAPITDPAAIRAALAAEATASRTGLPHPVRRSP